jgi:hypothetical protein
VEVLWVALVKAANRFPGKTEYRRMTRLVAGVPLESIKELLHHPAVDVLLGLEPPLETVLASSHERLEVQSAAAELTCIRQSRDDDPGAALIALGAILKRIRNKRVHGFKTRQGERDGVILGAARPLLFGLVVLVVQALGE